MRVLVTATTRGTSGLADYTRLLAGALSERGYELGEPADVAVYSYTPYAAGVYTGWLRAVREARELRRRVDRLVVVFHEVFVLPDRRLRMRLFTVLQRWATGRLDKLADTTVVADAARAQRLAALCPRAGAPAVIPVGPNIPVPATPRRSERRTVVVFGLLHPDRDIETVVHAAGVLQRQDAAVRLRIVGDLGDDPDRADRLRRSITDNALPATIEGFLAADDVAAAFAGGRVFVSTYTSAVSLGSGTVAAAFGFALPVVVYQDATLDEALVPGKNVLVAEREQTALATAIALALGDEGTRVGEAGRALYDAELAWPRIAERFDELLAK